MHAMNQERKERRKTSVDLDYFKRLFCRCMLALSPSLTLSLSHIHTPFLLFPVHPFIPDQQMTYLLPLRPIDARLHAPPLVLSCCKMD
mmetsp:Transcript_40322/g.79518  ORF Transcript_40322/g.79518 Transcript_40322/m.79518 type:complete len:88 (-) Transcript_40322:226-489(-)